MTPEIAQDPGHAPVLLQEAMDFLAPTGPGVYCDATVGLGGHSAAILERSSPSGRLIAIDRDRDALDRAGTRLVPFGDRVSLVHGRFGSIRSLLEQAGTPCVDGCLVDLGVSSMQLDNPSRGFSMKLDGPLDMRMNPHRGQPASGLLEKLSPAELAVMLEENSDENYSAELASALAGHTFATTGKLAAAIRATLPRLNKDTCDLSIRRVFQALRIAVNDEFSALETFLRLVPTCLNPGGRVAVLTFHSGEDRRVKKAFASGFAGGIYSDIAHEIIRPSSIERNTNPRSAPAKLRWARKV